MNCYEAVTTPETDDCFAHYTVKWLVEESGLSQSEIKEILHRAFGS